MKATANIATYPLRLDSLCNTLDSIEGQFDEVRVVLNEYTEVPNKLLKYDAEFIIPKRDLKDNGKFYSLQRDEYYFTMDDDIIYPSDYAVAMLKELERRPIVTHHGRLLLGKGRNYYSSHKRFHFLEEVKGAWQIDVLGTGVTAFRTNEVCPTWITYDKRQCMTDLLLSLHCAEEGIPITLLPHGYRWFGLTEQPVGETIFEKHHKKCEVQSRIADEIYHLIYLSPSS